MRILVAVILAAAGLPAVAQPAAASAPAMRTDFPPSATAVTEQSFKDAIVGKVLRASTFDGMQWRMEYRSNGYGYLNVPNRNNFSDSGAWSFKDGKLCVDWRRTRPGCNEVRMDGGALLLKRDSGEVVALNVE